MVWPRASSLLPAPGLRFPPVPNFLDEPAVTGNRNGPPDTRLPLPRPETPAVAAACPLCSVLCRNASSQKSKAISCPGRSPCVGCPVGSLPVAPHPSWKRFLGTEPPYRKEIPPEELADKAGALWNFPSKNFSSPSEGPFAEMTKIHSRERGGGEEGP